MFLAFKLTDTISSSFPVPYWALIVIGVILLALIVIIALNSRNSKKGKKEKDQPALAPKKETKPAEPVVEKKPAEVKAAPVAEKKPEPVVEKKAEPVVEKKPEPAAEKKAEPVVEKKAEPVVEKKAEPVVEKKAEPAAEKKAEESLFVKASQIEEDEADDVVVEKQEAPAKPAEPKKVSPRKKGLVKVIKTDETNKPVEAVSEKKDAPADVKVAKPAAKKAAKPADDEKSFGKYVLKKNEQKNPIKPFSFELRANNGQLLFESEGYKIKPRANSIEAFKKHTQDGTFIVDKDKNGGFRYKLYKTDGTLLGVGETYSSNEACLNSIESTKRFAITATKIEDPVK